MKINRLDSFDLEGIAFIKEGSNKELEFAISAEEKNGTDSKVVFATLKNNKLVINNEKTINLPIAATKTSATKKMKEQRGFAPTTK